jgi:hypothetical protein
MCQEESPSWPSCIPNIPNTIGHSPYPVVLPDKLTLIAAARMPMNHGTRERGEIISFSERISLCPAQVS